MARLPIEVAPMMGLSAVPMRQAPAVSAQTWIRGAVLVNVSGEVQEGGANPTAIVGVAVHKNPPTNVPEETGQYIPAVPHVEFNASIDTSAALGTGVIAAADNYAVYGITEDASGVWYVDKNKAAATDVRVRIVRLLDPVGTINGRVRIQFLQVVNLTAAPTATTIYVASQ